MTERRQNTLALAVLLFGALMIGRGLWKRGATALGSACTLGSDECVDGASCMGFGDRGALCTQVCGTCPAHMVCERISVHIDGAAGVAMKREYEARYCVPRSSGASDTP